MCGALCIRIPYVASHLHRCQFIRIPMSLAIYIRIPYVADHLRKDYLCGVPSTKGFLMWLATYIRIPFVAGQLDSCPFIQGFLCAWPST